MTMESLDSLKPIMHNYGLVVRRYITIAMTIEYCNVLSGLKDWLI